MSILLIDPPRGIISKGTLWRTVKRKLPALGLAYIAAYLEKNGFAVSIIDMNVEEIELQRLAEIIEANKYQFLGITATTVQINSALHIAQEIKKVLPELKIVMGGPHPSVMTDEILVNTFVDYVVRGEGELTMLELVKGDDPQNILGLSFKRNGNLVHNHSRPFIEDLDKMPFPARHLLPMDKYSPTPGNYLRLPAASMITSRGCPGRCTFCNTDMFGKTIRFRTAKNISEEITTLIKDYKIKEVSFYDDTFSVNKKNIQELCSIILRDNIDITWSCMSRIDCMDPNLLKQMKKPGCHSICYGIESADREILENINKRISLDRVQEVLNWTKEAKIQVRVSFMFGNPGETQSTMEKTIRYAISLEPDIFIFNITTPFPGTAMFDWAKNNNYLKVFNWDDYDLGKVVMELPTVDPELIKKYYKLAYRSCYFRLGYFRQRLSKIRSFSALMMHIRIFKDMLLSSIQ